MKIFRKINNTVVDRIRPGGALADIFFQNEPGGKTFH